MIRLRVRVYFQNILNITNFGDILNFPSNFFCFSRIAFAFPTTGKFVAHAPD